MTREELDSASHNATITNGGSTTLEVDVSRGDEVLVLIDDGTTDNTPATYDMTQRVFTSEADDYQFYDGVTGETSRSWLDSTWGQKMEFEFTNVSGADATYRITILSYRSID